MSENAVNTLVFIVKLIKDFILTAVVALPLLIIELVYIVVPRKKKNIGGKLVVLTGGGNGFGKGMAHKLAQEGCKIVIVDIDLNAAEKTCCELRKKDVECKAYKVDISSYEEVEKLSSDIENDFGQVDILINNAGLMVLGYIQDSKVTDLNRMIRVNVDSHVWMCKVFLEKMIKNRNGHIVATSSLQGFYANPFCGVYSMSKFAVTGLMSSIREQLRVMKLSQSIKTTILSPYYIDTTPEVTDLSTRYRFPILSIEQASSIAIDGILREKQMIYIPQWIGLLTHFMQILPISMQQVARNYIIGEN